MLLTPIIREICGIATLWAIEILRTLETGPHWAGQTVNLLRVEAFLAQV